MIGLTHNPPAWSMGASKRGIASKYERDLANVGPGSHGAPLVHKRSQPAYSIAHKPSVKIDTNVPGPGAHEIASKMLESPGKTISMKLKQKDIVNGVGPGSYEPIVPKKLNHSYSIGSKLDDLDAKYRNY